MRLDKLLANAGYGTRSEVKDLLKNNHIKVNGEIVRQGKIHVDYLKDIVTIDDTKIEYQMYHYFVLNKPKGYVSANEDNLYPTVLEFFNDLNIKDLTHVGRLDLDTTGVLLITNDGKLNHQLIDPKNNIQKIYHAKLDKEIINEEDIKKLENGITLENGEVTKPCKTNILSKDEIELILTEGKYHQVKRMVRAIGYEVIELERMSFANLTKRSLELGEYYELNDDEILELKKLLN